MNSRIFRSQRNWQPRQIDRITLDNSSRALNFLPRLIACLVLADGETEFRRLALERCAFVNRELATAYTARTLQGAASTTHSPVSMERHDMTLLTMPASIVQPEEMAATIRETSRTVADLSQAAEQLSTLVSRFKV